VPLLAEPLLNVGPSVANVTADSVPGWSESLRPPLVERMRRDAEERGEIAWRNHWSAIWLLTGHWLLPVHHVLGFCGPGHGPELQLVATGAAERRRILIAPPRRPAATFGVIVLIDVRCSSGELPRSAVEAGIPVNARPEAEPAGGRRHSPAVLSGCGIPGGVSPIGQLALTAAKPRGDPYDDARSPADGGLDHGSSSFSGSRDQVRQMWSARLSPRIVMPACVACLAWQ
jgi:hypothetical protein